MRCIHNIGHSLAVIDDCDHVLTYTYNGFEWHPHVHPLNLPGQIPLTLIRSSDHPWHDGHFFSWKYVNGYNVWDYDVSGGPNGHGKLKHRSFEVLETETCVAFAHEQTICTNIGEPLLDDRRKLTVHPLDEHQGRALDWELEFRPCVDEVVLDRHIDWGGYAGLKFRAVRSWSPKLLNSNGENDWPESHVPNAKWAAISFWLDGLPSRTSFEHWATVAMFDHPENPRYPTPWLGYTEANIHGLLPGILRHEPLTLKKGDVLKLRYRVLFHPGKPDTDLLEHQWKAYTEG